MLFVLYKNVIGEKPELETGFKGTYDWKELQSVFVGGVDITNLMEYHFDAIEKELNK